MDLMERVKAECKRNANCATCKIVKGNGRCILPNLPVDWDIEAIREALGEEPKKINVPWKWAKGFPEIVAKKPKEAVLLLFEQQDEIIDCLEQIKEKMK